MKPMAGRFAGAIEFVHFGTELDSSNQDTMFEGEACAGPLQLLEYTFDGVSVMPVEGYVADPTFAPGLVFFPGKLAMSGAGAPKATTSWWPTT